MVEKIVLHEINFKQLNQKTYQLTKPNLKWFYAFFSNFKPYGIDYKISCISNGLEIRRNLKLINKIGLTNIQLTLDGLDKVHNKRKKK